MPRQRGDVREAIRAPSKDEIAPDHRVRHLTPSSYQKTLTTKDAMPHNKPRTLVLGAIRPSRQKAFLGPFENQRLLTDSQ
jgi:hypothetical protein